MPIYVYQCTDCGHRFERIMTVQQRLENKTKPVCPKCTSHKVEQRLTPFRAVTAHKG